MCEEAPRQIRKLVSTTKRCDRCGRPQPPGTITARRSLNHRCADCDAIEARSFAIRAICRAANAIRNGLREQDAERALIDLEEAIVLTIARPKLRGDVPIGTLEKWREATREALKAPSDASRVKECLSASFRL